MQILLDTIVTLTRYLSHYPRNVSMRTLVPSEDCHIIQDVTLSRVTFSKIHSTADLSEGRAKLREWVVCPVRAGC